jgi:primosomal protein N' (replication factor Y)
MFAEVIPVKRGPPQLPFFDYAVPKELTADLKVGQLVKIPFRGKEIFGIVKKLSETTLAKKILSLAAIVHPLPLLSKELVEFLAEFSEFYRASLGSLVKSTLLPLQKTKLKKLTKSVSSASSTNKFGKPTVFMYGNDEEKKDYLQSIFIKPGQHLIIVPEISDITAIKNLLTSIQQSVSGYISSDTSTKDISALWQAIWSGDIKIIIGTRRALFFSFHNLQSIIIDNENSENHKSWDSAPRFHAREAAFMLGKNLGAAVHLMGHRPLAETYYFVQKKIYTLASPTILPPIKRLFELVNPTLERRGGNFGPITGSLQEAIVSHPKGSIFLYCNRRGTGGYLMCRDCKTVVKCPNCLRALTYHKENQELRCHRCAHREPHRETCAKCSGINLAVYSPGTDAIANEIRKLFPDEKKPIVQIDSDTATAINLSTTNCIIIGTEAAWQIVPWNALSLIAFIDADTPLFVPEYRMAETVWQMINEARYRMPESAELIIQTSHPEHSLFANLTDPTLFYDSELKERKMFGYPPFSYLLKLFFPHPNKEEAILAGNNLYNTLRQLTKPEELIKITPPQAFFPAIQRGFYWQTIIIKLPLARYKELTKLLLKHVPNTWKVDPNPNTLLSL